MQLYSTHLVDSQAFVASREYAILGDICSAVSGRLSESRANLTEQVVLRSVAVGMLLGVAGDDLIRLEAAARIHRLGELFLDADLSAKSYLEMNDTEYQAYRSYPVFTALRVSQNVVPEVYRVLLRHREYCSGNGLLGSKQGPKLPLGARILCAVTEYEELIHCYGGTPVQDDAIQRRLLKDVIGRYDPDVLKALFRTIAMDGTVH